MAGLLTCLSCTSSGTDGPVPPGAASTTPGQPIKLSESLCSFIPEKRAAKFLTGSNGGLMISVALEPAADQIAGCEFGAVSAMPSDIVDIVLSATVRDGTDTFARLQANPKFTKLSVNGNRLVWDAKAQTLYAQFLDKNPTLAGSAQGVDSIVAVTCKPGSTSYSVCYNRLGITADSWAVSLATGAIDGINRGKVLNTATALPEIPSNRPYPTLVGDNGKQVPEPVRVLLVFSELVQGNNFQLSNLGPPETMASWPSSQMPYLSRADIRAKILESMTAHPHCDNDGCTYPGFVKTGWDSDTARADGKKLGIDPSNLPDPRLWRYLAVYTSNFPGCMCHWLGTTAPSTEVLNAKRGCMGALDATVPEKSGDIDGDGKSDKIGFKVCAPNNGAQELVAHVEFGNGSRLDQVVSMAAQPSASWEGITDVNGDHRDDLFVIDNSSAHASHVLVLEYRDGALVVLRGDLTADQLVIDNSIASAAGFTCSSNNGRARLVTWGVGLDSNSGRYTGDEETYDADNSGAMRRVWDRKVEYPAVLNNGSYDEPKEVQDRAGAHCPGLA